MLIDLHVYTRQSGGPELWKAVDTAEASNLDGILVADKRASAATAMAVVGGEFDAYPVFVGVEIATRTGDVVVIPSKLDPFLTREEWRQLDALDLPTLEEVQALAKEEDAVILVAHPYERRRKNAPRDRIFAMEDVAGVEVSTTSAKREENRIAVESVGHASLPAYAGSAETRPGRGSGWATLFGREVKDQADLVAAIREGNFWAVELDAPDARPPRHSGGDRGGRGGDRGGRGGDRGGRGGGRGDRRPAGGGSRGRRPRS